MERAESEISRLSDGSKDEEFCSNFAVNCNFVSFFFFFFFLVTFDSSTVRIFRVSALSYIFTRE